MIISPVVSATKSYVMTQRCRYSHSVSLILVLLILSGCTFKGLVVKNLDWLITSEIDSYVDLTDPQEEWVEKRISTHLLWMQKELLPELQHDFDQIIAIETPFSKDQINTYINLKPFGYWQKIMQQLAPDAATLFSMLSKEQYEHLAQVLNDKNKKNLELASSPPQEYLESYGERLDRRVETIEDYVGDLSPQQELLWRTQLFIDQEQFSSEQLLRQEVRNTFIKMVSGESDTQKILAILNAWQTRPLIPNPARYDAYRSSWRDKNTESFLALEATLTPEQRQTRIKKLKALRTELQAFAKIEYR